MSISTNPAHNPAALAAHFSREDLEEALEFDRCTLKFDCEEIVPRSAVEEALAIVRRNRW